MVLEPQKEKGYQKTKKPGTATRYKYRYAAERKARTRQPNPNGRPNYRNRRTTNDSSGRPLGNNTQRHRAARTITRTTYRPYRASTSRGRNYFASSVACAPYRADRGNCIAATTCPHRAGTRASTSTRTYYFISSPSAATAANGETNKNRIA